jgi:hypothetical protein
MREMRNAHKSFCWRTRIWIVTKCGLVGGYNGRKIFLASEMFKQKTRSEPLVH